MRLLVQFQLKAILKYFILFMILKLVNIHIKFLSNNIFFSILNSKNQIKKIYTLGSVGFSNRNKKIFEVFNILLTNSINYILSKKLKIYKLRIENISQIKFKALKQILNPFYIKYCKIIEKTNYNGCRLKKKNRKSFNSKIKRNKKFILRI